MIVYICLDADPIKLVVFLNVLAAKQWFRGKRHIISLLECMALYCHVSDARHLVDFVCVLI